MRLALGVEYDGSAFSGYQLQRNSPSIQQSLQAAISQIAAESIVLSAAGRTDAGVHATQQVVAFSTEAERPLTAWIRGTNALTPAGVKVQWAERVADDFHPRFQATARRYMYLFYESSSRSPLLEGYSVQSPPLDDEEMHRAAAALVGEQDFSAFRGAGCQSATPYRCVHRVSVQRAGGMVILDISANAFLLHMVRNIAGSLWQIGQHKEDAGWIRDLLIGRDRREAASTAPPQGLYLVDVRFPGLKLPPGRLPGLLRGLGGLDRF
ncbi:MAG: tRNA pseudouridine(38-40) synthase TruA [Pseudomonadales bacterium]